MGPFLGKPTPMGPKKLPPLLMETQTFAMWTIEDVKKVMNKLRTQIFGFSLIESQFESVVSFRPDVTTYATIEDLFRILDNDHDGRIDGLEFIGSLVLVCRASFEEKVKLLFEAFDFNLGGSLSKTELTMMITSCVCGLIALTGQNEDAEPDLKYFEKIIEEAFQKADRDQSGYVSFEEFIIWARSNRDIMTSLEIMNKVNADAIFLNEEDSAEESDEDFLEDEDLGDKGMVHMDKHGNHHSLGDVKSKEDKFIQEQLMKGSKQWRIQVADGEPTNYPYKHNLDSPASNLQLQWIHGQGKSNVRYISLTDKEPPTMIAYTCACVAIVYNIEERSQRFYQGHTNEILCLAIHPNGHHIATGDTASNIHVWDALTRKLIRSIKVLGSFGVKLICFSPNNGDRIASVSRDLDHTVSLHDCASGLIIGSGRGFSSPNDVFDMAYSPSADEIVIVGRKKIKFFRGLNAAKRDLGATEGKIGHKLKKRTYFCVSYVNNDAVLGCSDGSIYLFQGVQCVRAIQAHALNEPVLCMVSKEGILVTGGKDGLIKSWDSTFKEIGAFLDMSEDRDGDGRPDSGSLNVAIQSVDVYDNNILVNTKGADIFNVKMPRSSNDELRLDRISSGHPTGQVWGLAAHPLKEIFATCGDDKTLRLWSLRGEEQISLRLLPDIARAVAYSPDGEVLALGMGNGSVALIEANSQSLRAYSTFSDSKEQISQIKFSNDGLNLAIGSTDSNIYIYRSTDKKNFRKFSICRGHNSAVCHIDFSSNSLYLRSNGIDETLMLWDVHGNQMRIPHYMRDTTWASNNCAMTWATQGLWSNDLECDASGEDFVNTCDAVPELDVTISGYSDGKVKLHRYPTPNADAISQVYSGHAEAISNVTFSGNKHFAVSVGKDDRAILIWKHELEQHDSDNEDVDSEDYTPEVFMSTGDEAIPPDDADLGANVVSKPWKKSIIEPDDVQVPPGATDVDLELEWVHGFRSSGCRNNLCYSGSGEVVFHAAALAIVQSKGQGTQRFLQGVHFDDIISFAMHPSGEIFATGDESKTNPKVVVWNALDMKVLSTLVGTHKEGICLLAFNPLGDLLASVGLNAENTLMVHDWKTGVCLTQTSTDRCKLSAISFMSEQNNVISLVSASEYNLKFWQIRGQNVQCQQAIWGKSVKGRVKCMVSMGDDVVITGTSRGLIHIWCGHCLKFPADEPVKAKLDSTENVYTFETAKASQKNFQNPHVDDEGQCNGILSMWSSKKTYSEIQPISTGEEKEPDLVITADENGIIALWSYIFEDENGEIKYKLELLNKINLRKSTFGLSSYAIQSVCSREGVFLVGTQASEILEVWEDSDRPPSDGWTTVTGSRLNGSHASGEVWGLSPHPKKQVVYTTGDDKTVRVWNLASKQHKQVGFLRLPAKSRAVVVSPGFKKRKEDVMEHHQDTSTKKYHDGDIVFDVAIAMNTGEIWLIEASAFESVSGFDGNGINSSNLNIKTIHDAQMVVTEMKYSSKAEDPNTLLFAVGCHNSFIYIYSVYDNYELHYLCLGHTNFISHMDFGCYNPGKNATNCEITDLVLQSCCGDCVVKFWTFTQTEPESRRKDDAGGGNSNEFNVEDFVIMGVSKIGLIKNKQNVGDAALYEVDVDGTSHKMVNAYRLQRLPQFKYKADLVTSLSSVKNTEWFTMTCPFNWAVQGIWPSKADGSEINAITRSNFHDIVPVIATADDYGSVKLFNYPCVVDCAPDKCYRGHSAQITNISFNHDDSYCISVGGEDQCVFIWATDCPDERREKEEAAKSSRIARSISNIGSGSAAAAGGGASAGDSAASEKEKDEVADDFENTLVLTEPKSGDEFTAVKPWKASIREPVDFVETPTLGTAPTEFLELNWVYGYRSWDCRNNIDFADSLDEIVYHVAGVGIVVNSETQTQVHNLEHDDDILCLAVHPQGHTVATGEVGRKPKLVIWDANTGMTLRVIQFHSKGISQVAFTQNGTMVISVGMDDNRLVAVHNLATGILIGKGKAGRGVSIYGIAVGPKSFVTCGKNHVKFWDLPNDNPVGELSSKTGLFGKVAVKKTAVCTAFLNSDAVTGMSDGNLLQWKGRTSATVAKGHTKAVTAMCSLDQNHFKLASGGADGKICLWNSQMQKVVELSVSDFTPSSRCAKVQALNAKNGHLVVGTIASEIYEVDITASQRDIYPAVKLVNGHCEGSAEIWGLSSHPKMKEFATAGDDMTVRIWDSRVKQMKALIDIPAKARTIAYNADGSQLAVGLMDGKLIVLNVQGSAAVTLAEVQVSKKAIQVLTYSPDGRCLAAGAHDSRIYLMDTKTFGSRAQCKGHHSFISHLDFSKDGKVLQSVSGDYELLFWDVATGKQIVSPTEVRDTKWNTSQSILGWGVKGIWPPEADGTDVNAVSRSPDESLLATGDDYGKVKLFRYPCCKENSKFKEYKGHSAHVANVRFSSDGNHVFSVGGLDKAVMQFEVKRAKGQSRQK